MSDSNHITTLLQRWQSGDASAQDELFQIVYGELRRIAGSRLRNEMRPNTLQATELVNEIYPQLARQRQLWQNRSHFYAIASECMRRYLVDHARTRSRQKRGGDAYKISISDLKPTEICHIEMDEEVLAVDRALSKLAELDETAATVIKQRYFGGMKREEIAEVLEVSPATVDRTYRFAKAWLKRELAFEFSPYLLSVGQICDKTNFLRQLRRDNNNPAVAVWRDILPDDLLDKIENTVAAGNIENLLIAIVAELNKNLLGSLYNSQSADNNSSDDKTEILHETLIKSNRRMLENAFDGRIIRLT